MLNQALTVKEITELDLYNDLFKKVEIKNSILNDSSIFLFPIEEVDTLILPFTFVSDKTYKIDYLQSVSQDYSSTKLVRRTPGRAEYRLIYDKDDEQKVSVNSGFETPWRIIHISNNLK